MATFFTDLSPRKDNDFLNQSTWNGLNARNRSVEKVTTDLPNLKRQIVKQFHAIIDNRGHSKFSNTVRNELLTTK